MYYHQERRAKRRTFFGRTFFWIGLLFSWRHWYGLMRKAGVGLRTQWWRMIWACQGFFRVTLPVTWRSMICNGLSPWIMGPDDLDPDAFLEALERERPRTASQHFWSNPLSEWHAVSFFFRKGRMWYMTTLPFNQQTMGYYPEGLPDPYFALCRACHYAHGRRTSLIRRPADVVKNIPPRTAALKTA